MKTFFSITLLLFFFLRCEAGNPDQCFQCHSELETPEASKYLNDVHHKIGISCASCHGGDPAQSDMEAAMDPQKGFIGVPVAGSITDTCLACHADSQKMSTYQSKIDVIQFQEFPSSVHAKADIATCVTCHPVHEIRSKKDQASSVYPKNEVQLCGKCHGNADYMKKFDPALPTDQLEKYATSVHGKKLSEGDIHVATCSDCHGNHAIFPVKDPRSKVYAFNIPSTCGKCHADAQYMKPYGIPTDQLKQFTESVHGVALLKQQDSAAPACNDCHGNHGAAPPGILSVSHVCGQCHALNAEYFAKGPHAAAFEAAGLPQCESCHGNHGVQHPTDAMIRTGKNSICEECHSEGDKGYRTASEMYQMIDALKQRSETAAAVLKTAEEKGMDVSDAKFKFKEISGTLIKARTVIHTVTVSDLKTETDHGLDLAADAAQAGHRALEEYSFRRKGLGVSTLFITLLVVALYWKVRKIEATQKNEKDQDR